MFSSGGPCRPSMTSCLSSTPNPQVTQVMESFEKAAKQVRKEQDAEAVLQPCREQAVTRAELNTPRNGCAV